jgi:hypothetical protein
MYVCVIYSCNKVTPYVLCIADSLEKIHDKLQSENSEEMKVYTDIDFSVNYPKEVVDVYFKLTEEYQKMIMCNPNEYLTFDKNYHPDILKSFGNSFEETLLPYELSGWDKVFAKHIITYNINHHHDKCYCYATILEFKDYLDVSKLIDCIQENIS